MAPLVALLVKRLEKARDKKFGASTSFGFACRAIAGTQTPSNHSFGLALDLDAPENPQLTAEQHRQPHSLRKTFPGGRVLRPTMSLEVEAIAERLGFRWGETFVTKPDPMHFEFMGSVADAGAITERAVNDFKEAHGLGANGVVGAKTWKRLR